MWFSGLPLNCPTAARWNLKVRSERFLHLFLFSPSHPHRTSPFLKWHERWDGSSPRSSRLRPHRWGRDKSSLTVLPFAHTQVQGRGERGEVVEAVIGATCGCDITTLSHNMHHLQLCIKPKETDFICHLWEDLSIIYSAHLTSRAEESTCRS